MAETFRFQQIEVLRREDGSLHELGRGAMGITYKAFDTNLLCYVALKLIESAYLNSDAARQRFLRGARAATALRHPNVAAVFHLGREADNYFYAMEFVDGETVEALIKREGAVPTLMALKTAAQVARALGAAQKQGLVHRDIKPSNVMFVREEGGDIAVKVIDFGLATSGFLGTPHFASPEQLEEREMLEDRAPSAKAEATFALPEEAPSPAKPYLDENVQFTVFRPGSIEPLKWYPLVAFAHLSAKRPDAPEDEPDPVQEVQRQARAALQERFEDYQKVTLDSSQGVPREGELTFVPLFAEVTFNPPRRTFIWTESVHREEFRMRTQAKPGQTLRGSMSVFLGRIILAEVKLTIRVASPEPASEQAPEPASAVPYRKIFASYSHKDHDVAEEFARLARAFGDEYLRDLTHLRAGEVWDERLLGLIEEADVFQLLWSSNSMRSPYVRREWEHALSLRRPNFIRPSYWEQPMPASTAEGLPPEELLRLQFISLASDRPPATTAETRTSNEIETPIRRPTQPAPRATEPSPRSNQTPIAGGPSKRPYRFPGLLALATVLVIGGILVTFSIRSINPGPGSDRLAALEESVRTSTTPSKVLPELVNLVNASDPALAGPAEQERLARAAIVLSKRLKNVAIEKGSNERTAQASEAAALAETAARRSGNRDIEREVLLLQRDVNRTRATLLYRAGSPPGTPANDNL